MFLREYFRDDEDLDVDEEEEEELDLEDPEEEELDLEEHERDREDDELEDIESLSELQDLPLPRIFLLELSPLVVSRDPSRDLLVRLSLVVPSFSKTACTWPSLNSFF